MSGSEKDRLIAAVHHEDKSVIWNSLVKYIQSLSNPNTNVTLRNPRGAHGDCIVEFNSGDPVSQLCIEFKCSPYRRTEEHTTIRVKCAYQGRMRIILEFMPVTWNRDSILGMHHEAESSSPSDIMESIPITKMENALQAADLSYGRRPKQETIDIIMGFPPREVQEKSFADLSFQ